MIDASTIENVLLKYGNRFLIDGNEDSCFYGIISPKKSHMLMEKSVQRIGTLLENEHLLIYPFSENSLSNKAVSFISMLNKSYCIKGTEVFYLCDKPLYRYAVLSEKWIGESL